MESGRVRKREIENGRAFSVAFRIVGDSFMCALAQLLRFAAFYWASLQVPTGADSTLTFTSAIYQHLLCTRQGTLPPPPRLCRSPADSEPGTPKIISPRRHIKFFFVLPRGLHQQRHHGQLTSPHPALLSLFLSRCLRYTKLNALCLLSRLCPIRQLTPDKRCRNRRHH